ncbi:hypothetical protein HMPREF3181_00905 [Parvimonas sp. KA00067]|jgi:hypothetical protein|uniref:hypothetical protein n=1 Tax=Parvimonas sp. KA00067 TaxID=1588755 RepID=UPI00061D965E|nr:hypothetical protein [Parvimonas sp. KA00067]KXB46604.1 hypothetical protein HMPREF3188_00679 [Tissierellia bacterium KA00581]KXB66160.1 hypothetical protein HMPREF3181_00905 [Parvimonas sp. KA00067]
MSVIAKECIVGYYDKDGEYNEIELKQNKEYTISFKAKLEHTDGDLLIFNAHNCIEISVDDITGINEVE